jgi:hypothetical protein
VPGKYARHGGLKTESVLREESLDNLVKVYVQKKMINYSFWLFLPDSRLTGFNLFNCSATLFKENSVPAVGAPDIDVYLDFLFTPGAFIRACHMLNYPLTCSRVRSIARWAIFIAGVCGWYAPPANL